MSLARWPNQPRVKPDHGFFTSSWDVNRQSCSWLDFVVTTQRKPREGERLWLLVPKHDAMLIVVNSPGDYQALVALHPQRYGENEASGLLSATPHWSEIARSKRWTGVHMADEALANKDGSLWASAWAVESTLWFDWAFTTWECEGSVTTTWQVSLNS